MWTDLMNMFAQQKPVAFTYVYFDDFCQQEKMAGDVDVKAETCQTRRMKLEPGREHRDMCEQPDRKRAHQSARWKRAGSVCTVRVGW